MSVDFDVRGQQDMFSLEEALLGLGFYLMLLSAVWILILTAPIHFIGEQVIQC